MAADYFIDTTGANGAGTALSGTFGSPTVSVSGTITASTFSALGQGTHTIYVQGEDAAGNWGTLVSTTFVKDTRRSHALGPDGVPQPDQHGACHRRHDQRRLQHRGRRLLHRHDRGQRRGHRR